MSKVTWVVLCLALMCAVAAAGTLQCTKFSEGYEDEFCPVSYWVYGTEIADVMDGHARASFDKWRTNHADRSDKCKALYHEYICASAMPECVDDEDPAQGRLLTCRSLCEDVNEECDFNDDQEQLPCALATAFSADDCNEGAPGVMAVPSAVLSVVLLAVVAAALVVA